jgi:hypothetical protein
VPLLSTASDARDLAIVALVAIAPLAIVLIVALLRGYTISLHLERGSNGGRGRE